MRTLAAWILAGVSTVTMAQAGFAQSAAPAANGPTAPATPAPAAPAVEDIIVTARRSAERLQSVPVSVTALSAAFIDHQNITDATAIGQFSPSLTIAAQPASLSAATVFIRGIGNSLPTATAEPSVGIYLDGVYIARTGGALFDLVDLERIEVLRGPQGTTFGRNTIGGALQLISKKPADDFHATFKAGYGNYNDSYLRGRVDTGYLFGTPIKMSIAAEHHQADGYVNNTLAKSSDDPGSLNANSAIVAVEGDFGKVKVNYNFDYDDRKGAPPFFQLLYGTKDFINYFSQSAALGGAPFSLSPVRQQTVQQIPATNEDGSQRFLSHSVTQGHGLTITYDVLPELTLKSITGYRKFDQTTAVVLGGNGNLQGVVLTPPTFAPSIQAVYPFIGVNGPQPEHQFSQELQALGKSGDFSYLGGVYYFDEKAAEQDDAQHITFVNPGGTSAENIIAHPDDYGTSKSFAVFGQLTWRPSFLNQKLELTGGGRYTSDKKTALVPAVDGNAAASGAVSFHNGSYLASASYHFTNDFMLYGRVSSGYHSGGINTLPGDVTFFAPETATAYEAGIKSEFFAHRLRFNIDGYITDYNNMQINQFAPGTGGSTTIIVNAGKVRLEGIEAEFAVVPTKGLSFDGSFDYLHTHYIEFLFADPTTGVVSNVADQAHQTYSPTWQYHVGGEYFQNVGIGTARLRVDYSHRSAIYFNPLDSVSIFNEQEKSPSDNDLKARLSLENVVVGGKTLEFGVWGDNLTNQKELIYSIDFGALGFSGGVFKKPISYGVDAKIRF